MSDDYPFDRERQIRAMREAFREGAMWVTSGRIPIIEYAMPHGKWTRSYDEAKAAWPALEKFDYRCRYDQDAAFEIFRREYMEEP